MSTGFNSNELISILEPRHLTEDGLNLTADQDVEVPYGLKTDTLIIPSTSTPTWNSYFVIDFREKNCILSNITLEFNTSTISGLTGTDTGFPNFNPAWFWINRIELYQNGAVHDTLYGNQQFIMNQLLHNDQDRLTINAQAGHYNNVTQRNTLSTTTSSWFVNLQTYFDQNNIPFFTNTHDLQLRVYMNSLADVVNQSTLTGTPVATINYCNMLAKIARLPEQTAGEQKSLMARYPFDHVYHDLRQMNATIQSGVSSATIILSAIVGEVAALMFVSRDVGSTTGSDAWAYNTLTSFEILNSSSTNIVGGQSVSRALSLLVQGKSNCLSSYLSEIDIGSSYGGADDNSANVFIYSFSQNLPDALVNGRRLGSYGFTGAEQIKLNFAATLTADTQIDIYALTESRISQGLMSMTKIPF